MPSQRHQGLRHRRRRRPALSLGNFFRLGGGAHEHQGGGEAGERVERHGASKDGDELPEPVELQNSIVGEQLRKEKKKKKKKRKANDE